MIKKLLHIAVIAVLACSCADNLETEFISPNADLLGYEHDGKVTFGINPDLGSAVSTKAMCEGVDIRNLYVAVFDSTGFRLSEYVKAEPFTTGPDNDAKYQYTVELKLSDKKRILHFIANGPDELRFGQENEVIGELYTSIDADENSTDGIFQNAYWQRIELPCIVGRPKSDDPDYDSKMLLYNDVCKELNAVKLIRNHSKVSARVHPDCKNFELEGFWFVNFPDCGTIAPYNRNTGRFMENYAGYDSIDSLESATYGNYQGFMLATTSFRSSYDETIIDSNWHPVKEVAVADSTVMEAVGYVYEREKALASPMYLLLKGKYYADRTNYPDTYVPAFYKVAMQDTDGAFYAMLRNFNYLVQVQSVSTSGYDSAQAALNGSPSGDISVNVDFQDLPNVSDGSARLTVSETTLYIIVTEGSTSARFWYKYEPDIVNHSDKAVYNDTTSVKAGDPFVEITYKGTQGSTGEVISGLDLDSKDIGGCRYITVNTTEVSDVPKTQVVTITGKKSDPDYNRYLTISRNVNLVLRKSLELKLTASPDTDVNGNAYVKKRIGEPVVLNLGIENGLPSSMFPLDFKIAPSSRGLSPDNSKSAIQSLPVRYGKGDDGRPAYWFEKSVTWTDYQNADVVDGMKSIPVYFSTILADSATDITVTHNLFVPGTVHVYNYEPQKFNSQTYSSSTHKIGVPETFSFIMSAVPETGKVTVVLSGMEPDTGSELVYKYTEGGKDYYELAVESTSASFGVVPFAEGSASIRLSAYKFDDVVSTITVIDADKRLHKSFDISGCQKVYGNNLVPGQNATISFYVLEAPATVKVRIGDADVTATKGSNKTIDGTTYATYTVPYTPTGRGDNSEGYYDVLAVHAGDNSVLGSLKVAVCGIKKTGDPLSSASQAKYDQTAGTGWYVIENTTDYHLYYNGKNIAGRATASNAYDYKSLFGFSAAATSTKVAVPSANASAIYFVYGSSSNATLTTSSSGTSYNFNNGTQFRYATYTRYWNRASNTAVVTLASSASTFTVTPVELVLPQ